MEKDFTISRKEWIKLKKFINQQIKLNNYDDIPTSCYRTVMNEMDRIEKNIK